MRSVKVMDAAEGLDEELTMLIVAHSLTTLIGCHKIVKLGKNNTIDILSYEEVIKLNDTK